MGIFSTIMSKLGFGSDAVAVAEAATAQAAAAPSAPAAPTTPVVAAMEMVDVVAKMDGLASANKEKLNWKTSIVDLMKLLEMDSSLSSRKDLGKELGCPAELAPGSAEMNMWLHKALMQRLAANGGNIPKELV